jgi:phosphatidylserine/phosphatidylglycerophosphate/cardiolipin synthase-like enzyme
MGDRHVVPIRRGSYQCTVTPPWYVDGSEYEPLDCSFELLINGEDAFRAVHKAVAGAQKSVCIICWGFQPSMFFIRDGRSPSIGQLLAEKADAGVDVRVLSWALKVDPTSGPLGIGISRPINVTGAPPLEESNTPGRWDSRVMDKPPTSTDRQYYYDQWWYQQYDEDQEIEDELRKKLRGWFGDKRAKNLHFVGRGFSKKDRATIAAQKYDDHGLSAMTKAVLAVAPSHHQKMVLVDYEDPEVAIGFVMGHNMLDEYWDTVEHSAKRRVLLKTGHPDPAPNTGPNGKFPRHDFSSRVGGPILGDLFNNFATAWQKETGQALRKPDFSVYPIRAGRSTYVTGQILRTQRQYGIKDIKKGYLQAINNASRFIHIENQYFRWPPLAEKIKACAVGMNQHGRKPEKHGPLYLFVITNSTDLGVGAGTTNTYRMLDSLGKAESMPQVAWLQKTEDINAKLGRATSERRFYEAQKFDLDMNAAQVRGWGGDDTSLKKQSAALDGKIAAAKAKEAAIQKEKANLGDSKEHAVIPPEKRDGLKFHICTLVAPDTGKGEKWIEVYIHAKLMTIDDAFMTIGSANINSRSMEVDSELNIIHCRESITQDARRKLWAHHTNGWGAQDDPGEAFDSWEDIMSRNNQLRDKDTPIASLAPFLRVSDKRSNLD